MNLNAKQFMEKYGIGSSSTVKKWFEAGYLYDATRDETTGVYSIPESIPCPHKANSKIKKNSKLFFDLLAAADLGRSVFPTMYPNIGKDTFTRLIKSMEEAQLIRLITTADGYSYLELMQEGVNLITQKNERLLNRIDIIGSNVFRGIELLATISTVCGG